MALAFRMPRGGMVLVIGGSVLLFGAYYGVFMTGETLADRLVVAPFVGTWAANVCVLIVSLVAVRLPRPREFSCPESPVWPPHRSAG